MANSIHRAPESFDAVEARLSAGTPPLANAAADAYSPKDTSYASVFPCKATNDKLKSDDQLTSELSNFSSPYSKSEAPNHAAGIKDVNRGLNAVDDAASHLSDAMASARNGDVTNALLALRATSSDLDKGGGLLDRAQPNVSDLVKGDNDAQKSLSEAYYREGRANSHIYDAQEQLRKGDIEGALRSMGSTSKEITEEQKAFHHNLAQLRHDDQTYNHPQGLKDIRAAITGGDQVTSDLNDAIRNARNGDLNAAIQNLRQSSGDLNSSGARLDSGFGNLQDLIGADKSAKKHIDRGYGAEQDASFHIDKAERLLREGDVEGAVTAMNRALGNVADEQANLRTGLRRLKNDYLPASGEQQVVTHTVEPSIKTTWNPYEAMTVPMQPYQPAGDR